MESKFELERQAKHLIETDPSAAVEIYRKLWNEFQGKFNAWDAFYSIQAMRKASIANIEWARILVAKFEDEKVRGLFAWLVFDVCVKNREKNEILGSEELLSSLVAVSPQKNIRQDPSYPCPTTISMFKLIDAHSDNQFNAGRINDLLDLLNVSYLSCAARTMKTEERGDVEVASNFEKYYALKTKALLKLEQYSACKSLCEEALAAIDKFHYDNDLWFQMRIAICNERLGNVEESKGQFERLLSTKKGSDKWFIYKDISELYYEQGTYDKAWEYAISATLNGNEPQYMIKLYSLQIKILNKLERLEEGATIAELIAAIIKEQQWRIKDNYARMFEHYGIEIDSLEGTGKYLRKAQDFWIAERYKNVPRENGKIVYVHTNGKFGKIEDSRGRTVGFHRKHFTKRPRNMAGLKGASVAFYAMPSYDGGLAAENIVVTSSATQTPGNENIGKVFLGTVKNIVEFGIFVEIEGHSDGLLHKSKIPQNMRMDFQRLFNPGDDIQVEVVGISEKGMQLKLV